MIGLQVLAGNPLHGFHRLRLLLKLLRQPAVLGHPVADETSKVPTPCNNHHPNATEELLRPFHVPRGQDQDTLGIVPGARWNLLPPGTITCRAYTAT